MESRQRGELGHWEMKNWPALLKLIVFIELLEVLDEG